MLRRFFLGYLVVIILLLIALAAAVPAHAVTRTASGKTAYGTCAQRASVDVVRWYLDGTVVKADVHYVVTQQVTQYKSSPASGCSVAFTLNGVSQQIVLNVTGQQMVGNTAMGIGASIDPERGPYVYFMLSGTVTTPVTQRIYRDEPLNESVINLPANTTGAPVTYNLRDSAGNVLDSITLPAGAGAQTWSVGWQGGAATLTRSNPVGSSSGTGWVYGDGGEVVVGDVTPTMTPPPLSGTGAPPSVGWNTSIGTQDAPLDKADFRTGIDALNTSIRNISISGGGSGPDYTQLLTQIRDNTAALTEQGNETPYVAEDPPELQSPFTEASASRVSAFVTSLPVLPQLTPPGQQSSVTVQIPIPRCGTYSVIIDLSRWQAQIHVFRMLMSASILLLLYFISLRAVRDAFAG